MLSAPVYCCVPWAHDCSSLSGWKVYEFFENNFSKNQLWAACFRSECPWKNGGRCKPDENLSYKCDCSPGFTVSIRNDEVYI